MGSGSLSPRRAGVLAGVVMVLVGWLPAGPARAHDVWLLPSTFRPAVGELVRVDLRVGHAGSVETLARNDRRLVRLVAMAPSGTTTSIPGLHGAPPAGVVRPAEPGLHRLVYEGNWAYSELPADRFEAYLREHHFTDALELRRRGGEENQVGRERYSRSIKSLLWVGTGDGAAAQETSTDTPLGLPLELVVESWPSPEAPTRVEVRLLWQGEPLAETLVRALSLPADGGEEPRLVTTDGAGRVRLDLPAGVWMLAAVHLQRVEANAEAGAEPAADWQSVWTSVTFELPGQTAP